MKKAAFLDRDGTINEDIGWLFSEDKIEFIPGSIEALRILQKQYLLFIITNQPGIEQGVFTQLQCESFSSRYNQILRKEGIIIEKTFFCPHEKHSRCRCIKPATFFIDRITDKYSIDLKSSVTAGDHPHDVEMGKNAGTKTVYLLSGHGRHHIDGIETLEPDIIAENLYEAVLKITGEF